MSSAVFGLLGVLLGAGIGLVGVWLQIHTSMHTARLDALSRLYSEFLEGVYELQRESKSVVILTAHLKIVEDMLGNSLPSLEDFEGLGKGVADDYFRLKQQRDDAAHKERERISRLGHVGRRIDMQAPEETAQIAQFVVLDTMDNPVSRWLAPFVARTRIDLSTTGKDRRRETKRLQAMLERGGLDVSTYRRGGPNLKSKPKDEESFASRTGSDDAG